MEINMKTKSLVVAALTLSLLGAGGWSLAASSGSDRTKAGAQDKEHSMMMEHMGGGAMMGGGMMGGCPMMGQLPPGNEKLMMQMHADMMQAMGDIMRKYADKIQVPAQK
jgi:hypothetical protein